MVRTKGEAQSFLEQYEMLFVRIKCKQAEMQQFRDLAISITANMNGERVQSSGSKSKMANAVEACLACEEEIASQVEQLITKQKEVTQTLEKVENPTEYKLLHLRYVQFKELKVIADIFNSSYDWATTTHGRALKKVQSIMDRKE